MGRPRGSTTRKGAGASSQARPHPGDSSAPAPGEIRRAAPGWERSYEGRIALLSAITRELYEDDPSETRQRNLAAAMRGIRLAREESNEHEELEELRRLTAELQADREARAALESGVEFTHEAAELPPVSREPGN